MSVSLERIEEECRMEVASRAKHAAWTIELIGLARAQHVEWATIAEWLGLSRSTVIRLHQKGTP